MKFRRIASCEIRLRNQDFTGYTGNLSISNLRISFSVSKTLSWSANSATVRIWNISEDKRSRIKDYGDQITLRAGYREDAGEQLLFIGNTTQVSHLFDQPEIITTLEAGDGESILNQKYISYSFEEGSTVREIIELVAERMGINISEFSIFPNDIYRQGDSFTGMAKDALDKLCNRVNLTWSVQNGFLQILPKNQGSTKPPAEINADTGMIGIPQRFTSKRMNLYNSNIQTGWRVKTLLRPDINPGDRVRIKSVRADINGLFYVYSIRHEGDNYSPQWESTLEVILA